MAAEWVTVSSHPASGLKYQERENGHGDTIARIIEGNREVVRPSKYHDTVYRLYMAHVQRSIDEPDPRKEA